MCYSGCIYSPDAADNCLVVHFIKKKSQTKLESLKS